MSEVSHAANPAAVIRALRQAIYATLAFILLGLAIASYAIQSAGKLKIEEAIARDIVDLVQQQERMISQEVYLFQDKALRVRLQYILERVSQRSGAENLCLRLSTNYAPDFYKIPLLTCAGDISGQWRNAATVKLGGDVQAQVEFATDSAPTFSSVVPREVVLILSIASLLALVCGIALAKRLEVRILRPLLAEIEAKSRLAAIARLTQMVAHDVRRPFSMLKIGLMQLRSADTVDRMREITAKVAQEVDKSVTSANNLLRDILDVDSAATIKTELIDARSLIDPAINELRVLFPRATIQTAVQLGHNGLVDVDPSRISRVISNVLSNSVEAMKGRGVISISTLDVVVDGRPYIEFAIENDGPGISKEHLPHLFDAFFTSGKRGGTGLGLAIARKHVEMHSGSIWCESDGVRGVTFRFTLPKGS